MPAEILALTLQQPWATLIAHGPKRVENREWEPPPSLVGAFLAIHAGITREPPARRDSWGGAIEFAQARALIKDLPLLAKASEIEIGGRGDRFRYARVDHYINGAVPYGAVVAVARLAGVVRGEAPPPELPADQRAWYTGPVGWVLADVVALPRPVECKGERKLWELSERVRAEVRSQYLEVTRG